MYTLRIVNSTSRRLKKFEMEHIYCVKVLVYMLMVIWVVEFPRKEYEIRQIFGQKSTHLKKIIAIL